MSEDIPQGQVTVSVAVKLTGYSRLHIYNLLRSGKVKNSKYRIGDVRIFLIDKQSLLAYLDEQGRTANASA